MRRAILILCLVPVLSGCSVLNARTFRPTNYEAMPQDVRRDGVPTVSTLSMDASRRLMISQLDPIKFICSEPPPDAATSILAKAALEGGAKPVGGGEFSLKGTDEFQANALALAARTAAVEFWRTTSFSYCLLLMNSLPEQAKTYLETAERISPHFAGAQKPDKPDKPDKPGQ